MIGSPRPASPPVSGRAHVLGGSLAYTVAGSGPVVLLVHGLGGDRSTWNEVIGALSAAYTVIAVDLPGHGESEAPAGDYSLGAHATALRDLLIALDLERVSIAGHSLGGGVSLQFAYQFPERTERLLLISSGGLGSEVTAILRGATLPGAGPIVAGLSRLPTAVTRPALHLLPTLIARRDTRSLANGLRALRGPGQRRAFTATARTVIDRHGQTVSATRQLGLLRDLPILIAWGGRDKTIPPHHHRTMAAHLPHARTVEIPAAGHYPHETDPDQLLPAIESFLADTVPARFDAQRWRARLLASGSPAGGVDYVAPTAEPTPDKLRNRTRAEQHALQK